MIRLWKDVYETYKGDSERHLLRLFVCVILAMAIGYFCSNLADKALEMMSVTISILTGFTFTALFSTYSATTADLPPPQDESDRQDLARLARLEKNFQARAKFLILASVLSLIAIVLLSVEIYPKQTVKGLWGNLGGDVSSDVFDNTYWYATLVWRIGTFILKTVTIFAFFEAIYTFYRLSETVIAALEIRSQYKEARQE